MRTYFLSAMLGLAFVSTSFGQVKLEMKLNDGTHTSEITNHIEQKLTINGVEIPTSVDGRTSGKTTTSKRSANGEVRVQQKMESMQATIAAPGNDYSFDSANPDKAGTSQLEIVRDAHKALAKRSLTMVFDKDNKLTSVTPDQDYLGALPVAVQGLVKSEFDPEQLKKAAAQDLARLPTEAVNKGDTWDRTETVNLGAGQVMTFVSRYTYEGEADKNGKKLDKITSKTQSVDFNLEDNTLGLQLKNSNLKTEDENNVIWFDRERGMIVETNTSVRITGEITFVEGGNDLPAKLDLKIMVTATQK